jgi:Uma2 family endonuclease
MSERLFDLPRMTVEEYLAFEEASDVKHEYVDGRVYGMSGAHSRHGRIIANVAAHLWTAARGGPCRTYTNDLKVRASQTHIYYPDVLSVCTPRDDDGLIVDDPCLLLEVTSPSTSRTDHSEKLDAYRQIESRAVAMRGHRRAGIDRTRLSFRVAHARRDLRARDDAAGRAAASPGAVAGIRGVTRPG